MSEHSAASDGPTGLNVLFVAGFDSANYLFVELVRELQLRNHLCTVVVENEADLVNTKMFARAGIPTVPLSAYDLGDVAGVDVAFTGHFIRRRQRALFAALESAQTFVVAFANLFSSVTMRVPADLVITTGEAKFSEFASNGLDYRMIAIGNPQYDPLVRAREQWKAAHSGPIRDVLIVDQGAYPLGERGKRQLAQTLLTIAVNNPGITFRVKPRYLPDEVGEHLHSVSEHLYGYLTDLPDNLELIKKPTILEELVLDYDAMITTWSTAHLAATVLGMPLLLIEGLDSVDVFDVRSQRVQAAYDHLRSSGCVVDWRDLQRGPVPFAVPSDEYVTGEFYDHSNPSAPRVVDVLEALSTHLFSRGSAFAGPPFHLGFSEFMQRVGDLGTVNAGSEERRRSKALFSGLNAAAQTLVFENRCMGMVLDMPSFGQEVARHLSAPPEFSKIADTVRDVEQFGSSMKQAYFESHPEQVANDVFVQDQYFDWLRATGRRAELLDYTGPVVARESLEFNQGMLGLRHGRLLRASHQIIDSLSLSLLKECRVLRKDKHAHVLLGRSDSSLLANAVLFFMSLYRKHEALRRVDVPVRPAVDTLVFYKMRALATLGLAEEAVELEAEFEQATAGATIRPRAGWRGAVLSLVTRVYRGRRKRYARRLKGRVAR